MTSRPPAIRADGLGKKYGVGDLGFRSSFRDDLVAAATWPFRRIRHGRAERESLWALRDVSFEIARGEVVGLVGANGAGKTTLLKLLSRVSPPTTGTAHIHGRVGSLLDVAAGFHWELTGRENVFLNGAILGMTRGEIRAKFDEIIDFAEVGEFVDVPVKHYSSGMQVRLAFAVASSLEAEILFVDEVLAVGDVSFQRKCLARMEEVAGSGKTVIFVSHSAAALLRLCRRLLMFEKGRLVADGPAPEVMRAYLTAHGGRTAERVWPDDSSAPGDEVARIRSIRVRDSGGAVAEAVARSEPLVVEIEYEWRGSAGQPLVLLRFYNEAGICLFSSRSTAGVGGGDADATRVRCRVPGYLFAEGLIRVRMALERADGAALHVAETEAVAFQVLDGTPIGAQAPDEAGVLRPRLEWEADELSAKPA